MTEKLVELWSTVRQHLASARGRLSDPDDAELGPYEDFLSVNELGLALDVLADVAAAQEASGDVWRSLADAARAMDLGPGDSIHGATVALILRHSNAPEG